MHVRINQQDYPLQHYQISTPADEEQADRGGTQLRRHLSSHFGFQSPA